MLSEILPHTQGTLTEMGNTILGKRRIGELKTGDVFRVSIALCGGCIINCLYQRLADERLAPPAGMSASCKLLRFNTEIRIGEISTYVNDVWIADKLKPEAAIQWLNLRMEVDLVE
jgi:hypothetical protein